MCFLQSHKAGSSFSLLRLYSSAPWNAGTSFSCCKIGWPWWSRAGYLHTCMHAYILTFIHKFLHTVVTSPSHTHAHPHTPTNTPTPTHTYIHTHTHPHTHTPTPTHTHTHTHTHIHTHTQTDDNIDFHPSQCRRVNHTHTDNQSHTHTRARAHTHTHTHIVGMSTTRCWFLFLSFFPPPSISFPPRYIVGMSTTRLLIPLYALACPYNFLHTEPNYSLAVTLIAWVGLQVAVLVAQVCALPLELP